MVFFVCEIVDYFLLWVAV